MPLTGLGSPSCVNPDDLLKLVKIFKTADDWTKLGALVIGRQEVIAGGKNRLQAVASGSYCTDSIKPIINIDEITCLILSDVGIVPNWPSAGLTLCAAERRSFGAFTGGKTWERANPTAPRVSSRHPPISRCFGTMP